jgi:hypothetical protein
VCGTDTALRLRWLPRLRVTAAAEGLPWSARNSKRCVVQFV